MSEIIIRSAVVNDLKYLLEFEQGIITVERPYDSTLAADPISYYDIKELIEADHATVLVAVSGQKVVGSGYAKILPAKPYLKHEEYGYLGFMYVDPEYRGKGINRLIIEGLNDWLRSNNIYEVRLDVYAENHSAVKAYEKVGFERHLVNMRMSIGEK